MSVTNVSHTTPVVVTFEPIVSPKSIDFPDPSIPPLNPGSTNSGNCNVDGGVSRMKVWSIPFRKDDPREVLWSGIVPTGCTSPILVDPDMRRVLYDGMVVPQTSAVENYTDLGPVAKVKRFDWCLAAIVVVVLLIIIYLYTFRER